LDHCLLSGDKPEVLNIIEAENNFARFGWGSSDECRAGQKESKEQHVVASVSGKYEIVIAHETRYWPGIVEAQMDVDGV